MREFETVQLQLHDSIAKLVLNRPDKLNAMNNQMFVELNAALQEISENRDVRVLVLTGAGKAFCASADVDEERSGSDSLMGHQSPHQVLEYAKAGPQRVIRRVYEMGKPTLAMVNGLAVGDGFDLVLACDIRIGCERSRFMNAFLQMGLVSGTGSTWFLPRILGVGKALELLYTGDWLEAGAARELGVLDQLVPAKDLEGVVMGLAGRIASRAPIPNRLTKLLVQRGMNQSLADHLDDASWMEVLTLTTDDHREALSSFLEKRHPHFMGE